MREPSVVVARVRERIDSIARVGASEADTADERIYKEAVNLSALLIGALACVWVVTYGVLGLWVSAAIPFAYQLATLAGFLLLARTGRHVAFRRSQLAMMLLLPFLLQWSLGGFEASSAVGLWAVTAPFGALTFQGARASVPWFLGFLGLLAVSALIERLLPSPADIPSWLVVTFFFLNIGAVSLTAFLLLQYFVRARERAHVLLEAERERSERLLLNVLPASVAERLKHESGVIADRCSDVSVLFADLAGFTPAAERLPPEEVVGLLDGIFSEFDELVAQRGLEKIKTIGDGYMAAGGIPAPVPDHAERVADLALAMQAAISARGVASLGLRIGIDTGPVVAGVIGRSRFGYDLWGDTVNTASRMESHAPPGAIQVTERVRDLLADRFVFERRDAVDIKGKGQMTTYLLLGRRAPVPDAGRSASRTGAVT